MYEPYRDIRMFTALPRSQAGRPDVIGLALAGVCKGSCRTFKCFTCNCLVYLYKWTSVLFVCADTRCM